MRINAGLAIVFTAWLVVDILLSAGIYISKRSNALQHISVPSCTHVC